LYGLAGEHKHLPEIVAHSGLARRPIFVPSVGNFKQGMLVSIPLWLDELPGRPDHAALADALARHYAGSAYVSVVPSGDQSHASGRLDALSLNGTNAMQLHIFGDPTQRQAVLVAKLDNLGKGASGAAVQNLKLMLGMNEAARAA
ncbi:MAG TPA: N-acetyl-gamma-glutamyl-phosphate reductase, partial [Roseiarcus sp.]|nr:N-acetyl-gamma-glutamyl-phosphate reductase [Roseiarcus sp.]